jgi:hypothetical protein
MKGIMCENCAFYGEDANEQPCCYCIDADCFEEQEEEEE